MHYRLFFVFFLALVAQAKSQNSLESFEENLINWHHKDFYKDTILGMSTERAYNEILSKKTAKPVIVAIIDSGVDPEHEDLKENMWINEDEIPQNGIDDDKNGYVDDVNGWSFLGNAKGENIAQETLEMTRIYGKYSSKYEKEKPSRIPKQEKETYLLYQKAKKKYHEKMSDALLEEMSTKELLNRYSKSDSIVKAYLKKDTFSLEELVKIETEDKELTVAVNVLIFLGESHLNKAEIEKYLEHSTKSLKYELNVNYNPRKNIIGDEPETWDGKPYGSPDAKGPDPSHGTHVAGIVAAIRKNGKGLDGIASNAKIMSVRAVPDGDERDKDIAMAIIYAVDNGAQVINMSFGKSFSPQKKWVDSAVRYAEKKGVILVHAAGNDAQNTDVEPSYPNKFYDSKNCASNWINVGASTLNFMYIPAFFSNYGKKTVDVFAPGHEIYSLKPNNTYETNSGTSMAAPMVTGLVALLRSYYPKLTCQQIIDIVLQSGIDMGNTNVMVPLSKGKKSSRKSAKFKQLSKTGKIINVYGAVKMAESLEKTN
ncbi:MAG TPA: peptidase S8 [Cytophagales bacterium]|nr:peptidase S8 [Cytophagales bacterium]